MLAFNKYLLQDDWSTDAVSPGGGTQGSGLHLS